MRREQERRNSDMYSARVHGPPRRGSRQDARARRVGGVKRPLKREDLNVKQNTSPRRLMPHLLHQMAQNRTNLGGHSIQMIIIINQATT